MDDDGPKHDPTGTEPAMLRFDRDARVFSTGPERIAEMREAADMVRLAGGEPLQPPVGDLVVRQGNLRVTERLPDGRPVTRAVLQTGAVCRVRGDGATDDSEADGSPLYSLAVTTLEALGDTEVWHLPPGFCAPA